MGPVTQSIHDKLTAAFQPSHLEVVDDSARHAGHAGSHGGGESHFNVVIVSAAFDGQGRLQRQRAVYGALKDELAGPVHALSLKIFAPGEQA
jgi:BolA protein